MNIKSVTNVNICIKKDNIFVKITTNLKNMYENLDPEYFCLPLKMEKDENKDEKDKHKDEEENIKILEELLEKKGDEIPVKVKKRYLYQHWKSIFNNMIYQVNEYPLMDGDIDNYIDYINNNEKKYKNMVINVIKALSILEKCDLVHGDLHIKNVLFKRNNKDDKFMICDFDTLAKPYTMSWHACQPGWLEKRNLSLLYKPLNSVYWDLFVFMNSLHLTLKNKKKVVHSWMILLEKESLKRSLTIDKIKYDQIITLIKVLL
jgi:hypothetical protein